MLPIWKDFYITKTVEGNGYYTYSIETDLNGDDTTIFNGKAWSKPTEDFVKIHLNDYIKDYLTFDLPDLTNIGNTIITHENAIKTFTIRDENYNNVGEYTFIRDWSYKDVDSYNVLSNPPSYKGIEGMLYFKTYVENEVVKTSISHTPNELYKEVLCDKRYVLYYLNRYSGMDALVLEGNCKKKDSFSPYYIEGSYNNATTEFGKKIYHNDIKTSYELHTGWLNDKESENIAYNLFSSNLVYLHDLKEDKIMPVVITNTEVDYKTFRNNNNKLYTYTINVECSQNQYRL